MNPYPFVGLNHFTVPVGISCSKEEYCTTRLALTPLNEHINVTIARADREAPVFLGVANGASERQVFTAAKRSLVPKEELLQFEGLVLEVLPDARYRVRLDNEHELVAYTAGRMKKNRIKTLAGDRVTVEVSPYDLEKGRLIFRHKDERPALVTRQPQRSQFRRR